MQSAKLLRKKKIRQLEERNQSLNQEKEVKGKESRGNWRSKALIPKLVLEAFEEERKN